MPITVYTGSMCFGVVDYFYIICEYITCVYLHVGHGGALVAPWGAHASRVTYG